MPAGNLENGQRYRVRYRLDSQRNDRVFVGTFLGVNLYGDLDFDLRPTAGTSSLPREAIKRIDPVGRDLPHSQPEKVRRITAWEEEKATKAFPGVPTLVALGMWWQTDEGKQYLERQP